MLIYKATNKQTGESYIGKTTTSFNKRVSDHKYEAFKRLRQSLFYKCLRLFGWSNFEWEVLATAVNRKQLKLLERHYIIKYDTIDNGYNTSTNI